MGSSIYQVGIVSTSVGEEKQLITVTRSN